MRAPWHALAGILPESRLLASVAEFTHHRDIDALDHSVVLSLAELVPVNSVTLCKRGESMQHPVESIVVCSRKADGGLVVEAIDPGREGDPIDTIVCAMEMLEAISDVTDDGISRLVIPIQRDHAAIGALMLESEDALDDVRSMVEGFARIYGNYIALLNDSERDKLTGLYNRRSFEQRLQRLLKLQRQRARAPSSCGSAADGETTLFLAILDIDHFKRINDTYGHVYGDEVILMLAQQMRACFRQSDVLFRFGGEEFVVLLAAQDEAEVHDVLDRFRGFVGEHAYPQVGHVTVSVGYARITESDYPEIVLDRADKALYFAKQHGRDSVHGYEALAARGELAAPVALGSIDLF
ncbi:diguanylate cyclase (GGDEF) domain-containing protein [Luteibacter sp. UNCMF331Sha3.1]|uniref:GGDEF domain-containing protein n=1 Tax=Luteibacter sp. UNCMF331Sha3.1 TaxID=1502760 RepID=UPI0004B6E6D9|nr:GGDEF domain-containing protein [Luteibacter sp. UNCMF331Sha3.1]SEN07685.1 diguanylate cyclase (GGDEF) domain-containing protein [Luteibacter sp. UNCMF331Sha3.1]